MHKDSERVDVDGLPAVGSVIWPGQVYYTTKDTVTGRYVPHRMKGEEVAHVEQVGGLAVGEARVALSSRGNC